VTDSKDFKPTKSFKQFWVDDNSFSLELEVFKKYIKEYCGVELNLSYNRTLDSVKYVPANESTEVLTEIVEFAKKQEITVFVDTFQTLGNAADLKGVGFVLNEGASRDFRFEEHVGVLKNNK
jgi:hypothetical protein